MNGIEVFLQGFVGAAVIGLIAFLYKKIKLVFTSKERREQLKIEEREQEEMRKLEKRKRQAEERLSQLSPSERRREEQKLKNK